MARGPNIARVASLIGDNARAEVLSALMTGCSYTATELADTAGVTSQTISAPLGKLLDASLVAVDQQGRHRYFRLAGGEVADLLESLMGLAAGSAPSRPLFGPREPALCKARVCYDHLAGELGVLMYEEMLRHGLLERLDGAPRRTEQGGTWFTDIGIDVRHAAGRKRSFCRACLDWSERRHHLVGSLGAALLQHILDMGWAQREKESRTIVFSTQGEKSLRALLQGSRARDPTAAELQVAAWPEEE